MTNGDSIRAMSDEGLAMLFYEIIAERNRSIISSLRGQGVEVDLVDLPIVTLHKYLEYLREEVNDDDG